MRRGVTTAADNLLERDSALDVFSDAFDAAADGRGTVIVVEGSAGIGKSSVLREARARASARIEPLTATGSEVAREFPFGLVVELLAPELRDGVPDGAAAPARALFEPSSGAPPADEPSLLHALYWVVAGLSERRPLALLVDDAHWADASSLRFLTFLAERIGDLPVALVLAVRTGEPDAPADLLRRIRALPGTVREQLAPLTRDAVATLVEDDALADRVHKLTGGNPFFVQELVSAVRHNGVESAELEGFAPERILDAVLVRLRRLSGAAQALARAAAVLGPDARLVVAARFAELDRDDAAVAADELAGAEIVAPGEPVAFMHPLLRTSVYTDIRAATRARMHRRAAELLDDDGAVPAAVGGQLLEASPDGDPWVVQSLRKAAAGARARGAAEPAVAFLRRALDEPPGSDSMVAVLLELAQAEAAGGLPEAPGRLEEALALTVDAVDSARILGNLGWMLHQSGRLEEAAAAFESALDRLGDQDPDLRDDLLVGFIGAGWQVRTRAADLRRKWRDLLERADTGLVAQHHLAQLATLRLFQAEAHEGVVRYARQSLRDGRLIEEEGADSLTLWHAVGCLSWSDELDAAEAAIQAATADAERRGLSLTLAQCYYARSWPRLWRGQVDDAVSDAAAAAQGWRGDWGYYLPAALYWLVRGHLERGDLAAAQDALELPGGPERWGTTTMYVLWRHAEATVTFARGDVELAFEQYMATGHSTVKEFMVVNPAVMPWRSGAALAAAALDRQDEARRIAAEDVDLCRRFGAARPLGHALRTAGVVARGEEGVDLVREAVAVLERSPSRLELVHALVDQGALMRALGLRREAREPLRRALDLVRTCPGAIAVRDRAHQELVAAGGRPRREALTGAEALTPSERRIATLAADGLPNRAIAERLFVSTKTVEWHMSAVFRKLGIGSRAELQAALEAAE